MKKQMAFLLVLLLMLGLCQPLYASEDAWVFDTMIAQDRTPPPIPLLLIKINFDADGNGKDGYTSGVSAAKMKEIGEQFCHSPDSYWSELCFSDTGKSLKNYYLSLSEGRFCFTPAAETYANEELGGKVNDGVVNVTIPYAHPYKTTKGPESEDSTSRLAALRAACEFVDFSKFDRNGDGKVNTSELAVVYICGGYETSSSSGNARDQFGVHGHYTSGSGITVNGIDVSQAGFIRVGECVGLTEYLTMGTLAHELGHFLGAADLYDTDHNKNNITWSYASDMTLMASGSHSSFSGERRGTSPAYMDPYHIKALGLGESTTVGDGTYTLYSHASEEGDYNILKIGTPDPTEYYLVENRFGTPGENSFDAMSSGMRGIVIWHIDEYAISRGRVNNEGSGHDPGNVPMGVNPTNAHGLNPPYFFYYNENANERFYQFESGRYRFPLSETAYTTLTEEQAAAYGLRIEVLSSPGHEMQVRVSGAAYLVPALGVASSDSTTTTITFRAMIKDLCGGNVTACGLILSTKDDYTKDPNAVTIDLRPDAYGQFSATFEGLKDNTKYFCTAFTEGSAGRSEKRATGYTKAIPVPRDYYVAHLYMGKSLVERSFDVRLHPGETIPDSVTKSMKKNGYLFAGWYTDDKLTERFDLFSTQTELADITLFAKWVETELAATLTVHGATLRYGMTYATEVGTTYTEPAILPQDGYTFVGWFSDEELTIPFDFGMAAEDTEPVHLYAKWKSNSIPDDPEEQNDGAVIAIIVIALAVIAAVAVAAVVFVKRRKASQEGASADANESISPKAEEEREDPIETEAEPESESEPDNQGQDQE